MEFIDGLTIAPAALLAFYWWARMFTSREGE